MKDYVKVLGILLTISLFFVAGKISVVKGGGKGNPHNIIRIEPYNCELDPCAGYRCVGNISLSDGGTSVSPACYNGANLKIQNCKNGEYEYIPDFSKQCHDADYYYVWTRK